MNREEIITQCETWAKSHLDENFTFRKYQLESIVCIIERVLDKVKTQVMNAPTGAGKSLTAIIAAGVLWEYYKKKSYILVSDLSLFEQYENDLLRYNLPWGHLKGKDNYVCAENGNIVSCGRCALNLVGTQQLSDVEIAARIGYPCAKACEYITQRNLAINAPVTIMTYQLYLIQRNYVSNVMESAIFEARDFVICDEAHKLPDIIQNHFAPRMSAVEPEFMKTLNTYAKMRKLPIPNSKSVTTIAANVQSTNDVNALVNYMKKYSDLLGQYTDINEHVRKEAMSRKNAEALKKYLAAGNLARECRCKFGDFLTLCQELGNSIAVKTDGENETVINCIYEGKMIKKYFHDVSECELLMSATLGNLDLYRECIGMKDEPSEMYRGLDIPSTFDFSKSPIYFSDKNPMSYKEKANSIGPICKQIESILKTHKGERGIIQTGNYENTKKLLDMLPTDVKRRLILYGSAKEKAFAITKFMKSTNGVLVGPTLLEGLNFDGDKCRFAICMKLPYASLANNLVSAKKSLIPDWYSGDVAAKLEQGFGRGVRYNGDWCVNYILDGCIANFLRFGSKFFSRNTLARFRKL